MFEEPKLLLEIVVRSCVTDILQEKYTEFRFVKLRLKNYYYYYFNQCVFEGLVFVSYYVVDIVFFPSAVAVCLLCLAFRFLCIHILF